MSFRNGAKMWFDVHSNWIPRSLFSVMMLSLPIACTGMIQDSIEQYDDDTQGDTKDPTSRNNKNGSKNGIDEPGDRTPDPDYPSACEAEEIPARVWRLSIDQLVKTTASVFGFNGLDLEKAPGDAIDGRTGFNNGASNFVSDALTGYLVGEAEKVSKSFGDRLSNQFPCLGGSSADDSCVRSFVEKTGRRAFRRTISKDESDRYIALFKNVQGDNTIRDAAESVVQAMFLSPNFLYRSEVGDQDGRLEGWEIASALSYGLIDGPPSDALLDLAESGALFDAEERERVARELAAQPEAAEKMSRFMYWQMKLYRLLDSRGADLGKAMITAMEAETSTFVREVMASDEPTLTALYTGNFSYPNSGVAEIYGLDANTANGSRVDLPSDERFGIFTQPAMLAAVKGPIFRGLRMRELFLCEELPLPPLNGNDLSNELPVTAEDATEAEKWAALKAERPVCASCHAAFQPLGIAFDQYDDAGRFRTTNDYGREIDPSGELAGAQGWSGKFENAREAVHEIANSRIGRDCFAQRYLTYVLGREIKHAEISCLTRDVGHRFGEDGLNLHALMGAVAADQSTVTRFH